MMARDHRGDEPTPLEPTPLDDLLFGRADEVPPPDPTEVIPRSSERPGAEETQVVPQASPGRPPTTPAKTPSSVPTSAPAPAAVRPSGSVPEDWWSDDAAPSRGDDAAAHQGGAATPPPTAPRPARAPLPRIPEDRPRRARALGIVLLLLGALAAGALIALGVLYLMERDEPVASPTTSQTSEQPPAEEEPTEQPAEEPTTSSPTSSETTPPERTGELPSGATACGGPKDGISAGRTNDVTSCPFAMAVRDAYLAADPGDDGAATLTVASPVTGRSYTMRCSGAVVTTCTGGNDASVVLY